MSQERYRHLPFPDIPRWPGNDPLDDDQGWPADPSLDGVPTSKEDSVFSGEKFLPMTDTLNYLLSYGKQVTRKDQKNIATQIVDRMVRNAEIFTGVFQGLAEIETYLPTHATYAQSLRNDLEPLFEIQAQKLGGVPTEKQIGGFIELAAKNLEFEEKTMSVLRGYTKGVKTQREVVDLFYNMCLCAFKSNDPEIEKFVTSVLAFITSIITVEDKQAALFATASISMDDETLARFFDVDHSVRLLIDIHLPNLLQDWLDNLDKLAHHETYLRYAEKVKELDPARIAAIMAHYEREVTLSPFAEEPVPSETKEIVQALPFPSNLVQQSRPLRDIYWQRLANLLLEHDRTKKLAMLVLPDGTTRSLIIEEGDREALYEILYFSFLEGEGGLITDKNSIMSALTYLKPVDLGETEYAKLDGLRESLKIELWDEVKWMVSPRGDEIIVEDPLLKKIGILRILFELGENALETQVTLTIGKYKLPVLFDMHHTLKYADGKALPIEPKTRIWWETAILSYLRELLCRGKEEAGESIGISVVEGKEPGKKRASPRHHRRLLPPGQGFTEEQRERVLKETLGKLDLAKYNKAHGMTKRMGMYTWVWPEKEEERPTRRKGPNLLRLPGATEEIQLTLSENREK